MTRAIGIVRLVKHGGAIAERRRFRIADRPPALAERAQSHNGEAAARSKRLICPGRIDIGGIEFWRLRASSRQVFHPPRRGARVFGLSRALDDPGDSAARHRIVERDLRQRAAVEPSVQDVIVACVVHVSAP